MLLCRRNFQITSRESNCMVEFWMLNQCESVIHRTTGTGREHGRLQLLKLRFSYSGNLSCLNIFNKSSKLLDTMNAQAISQNAFHISFGKSINYFRLSWHQRRQASTRPIYYCKTQYSPVIHFCKLDHFICNAKPLSTRQLRSIAGKISDETS